MQIIFLKRISIVLLIPLFHFTKANIFLIPKEKASNFQILRRPVFEFCIKPFWWMNDYMYYIKQLNALETYNDAWYQFPEKLRESGGFKPSTKLRTCFDREPKIKNLNWAYKSIYIYRKTFEQVLLNPEHDQYGFCSLHEICKSYKLENIPINNELLTIYWAYYRCYRNTEPYFNCPNPCNRNPCDKVKNSNKICDAFYDPNIKLKLEPPAAPLRGILQRNFKCGCERGYVWDSKNIQCQEVPADCRNQDCHNQGICVITNNKTECKCHAAFFGEKCEHRRNRCKDLDASVKLNCGDFQCARDETSPLGYKCRCDLKKGFMPANDVYDPRCIDLNECTTYASICLNGAKCFNTKGSFLCLCRQNYIGLRCETKQTSENAQWTNWGPYSECSSPCSHGHKIKYRRCTVPYSCSGTDSDIVSCDNSRKCPDDEDIVQNDFIEYKIPNMTSIRAGIDNASYYIYIQEAQKSEACSLLIVGSVLGRLSCVLFFQFLVL
jgi:hypothetical protein